VESVRRYRTSACVLIVCLCAVTAVAPPSTQPTDAPIEYAPGKQIATLSHEVITESSGVAASQRRPGVFWTHNDSGDGPRLYAFDAKGKHLGAFTIRGATSRDWEDIASFTLDGTPYLLIADIGDNGRRHKTCSLHLVVEPTLPTTTQSTATQPAAAATVLRTLTFTYRNGPTDCESVAMDVPGRAIYLVTKTRRPPCTVYRLPLPAPKKPATAPAAPLVAEPVGFLPLLMATAADISPDGRRMVVTTYGDAFEYTRGPDETWPDAFRRPGRPIALPQRKQGEAICYGPDGQTLYLTSEKRPTPLIEVKPEAR
jgi:hypothetical protein